METLHISMKGKCNRVKRERGGQLSLKEPALPSPYKIFFLSCWYNNILIRLHHIICRSGNSSVLILSEPFIYRRKEGRDSFILGDIGLKCLSKRLGRSLKLEQLALDTRKWIPIYSNLSKSKLMKLKFNGHTPPIYKSKSVSFRNFKCFKSILNVLCTHLDAWLSYSGIRTSALKCPLNNWIFSNNLCLF